MTPVVLSVTYYNVETTKSRTRYSREKRERDIVKCLRTSVGPAYIIGEGNIATTVDAGSSTASFNMAACCCILTGRGTSSSLVQPPKGCKSRVGFL